MDEKLFLMQNYFLMVERGFRYYFENFRCSSKEGVDCFIFCDTNGGTLPHEVTDL